MKRVALTAAVAVIVTLPARAGRRVGANRLGAADDAAAARSNGASTCCRFETAWR